MAGAALLIGTLLGSDAAALAIYAYSGNAFEEFQDRDPPEGSYDASMRVTGTFTLAAPLVPNLPLSNITFDVLDASWNDGRRTVTRLESVEVATDHLGRIVEWAVEGFEVTFAGTRIVECRLISSRNVGADRVDSGQILTTCFGGGLPPRDRASVRDRLGTWTLVPEPSTVFLAGLGLALLGIRKRRRSGGHSL